MARPAALGVQLYTKFSTSTAVHTHTTKFYPGTYIFDESTRVCTSLVPTLTKARERSYVLQYDRNRDLESRVVYRSIGNGFNLLVCAWRIHVIKGGLLPLSIYHAHLSNYTGGVAQVCLLQPVICMTNTFSSRLYI